MKKTILSVILVLGSLVSMAQESQSLKETSKTTPKVTFGAKAGLNLANLTSSADLGDNKSMRTGLHIGAVAEITIDGKFSLQPEFLYSMQGAKYSEIDYDYYDYVYKSTIKYDYISIPMMAKYYVSDDFSLLAGPQISFLVNAEEEWIESNDYDDDYGTDDLKSISSSVDFGLNLGGEYKLENGLNFSARYNLGLTSIIKYETESSVKNSVFQFSVGYFFK